ncbi:MAG: hypothetical protein Q9M89_02990 [Persephonella sp.]|nr:hypothetical protein [Persephonella sp.]
MITGLTGRRWIVLEEKNRAPEFLIKKYGFVLAQLIYNRKELFNGNFDEDSIYPFSPQAVRPPAVYKS